MSTTFVEMKGITQTGIYQDKEKEAEISVTSFAGKDGLMYQVTVSGYAMNETAQVVHIHLTPLQMRKITRKIRKSLRKFHR